MPIKCNHCSNELININSRFCPHCGVPVNAGAKRYSDYSDVFFPSGIEAETYFPDFIDFDHNSGLKGTDKLPGMCYNNSILLVPSFQDQAFKVVTSDGNIISWRDPVAVGSGICNATTPLFDGIYFNIIDGNKLIRVRVRRSGQTDTNINDIYSQIINVKLPEPVFFDLDSGRYLITYYKEASEFLVVDISHSSTINFATHRYALSGSQEEVFLLAGDESLFLYMRSGQIVEFPLQDLIEGKTSDSHAYSGFGTLAFRPVYRNETLHVFYENNHQLEYHQYIQNGYQRSTKKKTHKASGFPSVFQFPLIKQGKFIIPASNGQEIVEFHPDFVNSRKLPDVYATGHFIASDDEVYILSSTMSQLHKLDTVLSSPVTGMTAPRVINTLRYGDGRIFIQTSDKIFIKGKF